MQTIRLLLTTLLMTVAVTLNAQNAETLYQQAKQLLDAEQYTQAVPKLEAAARKGHKKAQYWLGWCYDKGKGVAEDNAKAAQWYAKGAAQNHAKSQYQLGKCYLKGKGVAKDEARAKQLLLKAVNNPKGGDKVLEKLRKKAGEGDEDAVRILNLIGRR